ncbi:exo-beta-N-acetylmuramidase NamZ domain-containing protein [Paenibacillus sp. FJAT-26967]|uniref:exo-beta-N-acetylmuramidase NamZ family protein n=1 Tax=Paenibacillus sp. FJAT-26967 TaxID=1729690 RepID=UPI0008380D72|nr:DUF1343 domain-containing protein [Paenibacillus sp. FJAT-26967]
MSAGVRSGADRLHTMKHPLLTGRRIGLVTNPTGITADFRTTVEVCASLRDSQLTALYACEHGLYGQRQAGVLFEDETDPELGIPVYSLYGKHKRPTAEMLQNVDTVLFDIQDLGIRFYTYLSTLLYTLEACAEHGKSLLVLDRPNPLGGSIAEGGMLKPGYESMVGAWQMPIRSGMTLGELALMVNDVKGLRCDIDVIRLEGWDRRMEFTDTGLPWMVPSPNIPTIDSARVYGGTCFFEGTNLSEGRGTTRPFEWIGAPWLHGAELAKRMNASGLPGVHVHPVYATPAFSKHQGQLCSGVRLFVTDQEQFQPVNTGLRLLHEVISLHPDSFEWLTPPKEGSRYFIDLLTGGTDVRMTLADSEGLRSITRNWQEEAEAWKTQRKPYLLY